MLTDYIEDEVHNLQHRSCMIFVMFDTIAHLFLQCLHKELSVDLIVLATNMSSFKF